MTTETRVVMAAGQRAHSSMCKRPESRARQTILTPPRYAAHKIVNYMLFKKCACVRACVFVVALNFISSLFITINYNISLVLCRMADPVRSGAPEFALMYPMCTR